MRAIGLILPLIAGGMLSVVTLGAAPYQTPVGAPSAGSAGSKAATNAERPKSLSSFGKNVERGQRLSRARARIANSTRHALPGLGSRVETVRPAEVPLSGRRLPSPNGRGTLQQNTQQLGAVPHRGANPPAISGAAHGHRLESATIDGARVHRKP